MLTRDGERIVGVGVGVVVFTPGTGWTVGNVVTTLAPNLRLTHYIKPA